MHSISSSLLSPFLGPRSYLPSLLPHANGATGSVKTENQNPGFVEVGYISNTHGIRGEICVKTSTDFSELRFATPGPRWLRQALSHKESVKEVKLLAGREHPGQKTWIVRLEGIDSVEQAKLLVGSAVLVREEDRPEMEEGEYYSRDLIGMRVILKGTDELIGEVANVFDVRGTDLLQVMLYSPPGRLIWVPFVEAIVPDVDMNTKELRITPPKGLLELNTRSNETPKRERRQIEWKERKALQRRLSVAKKKLSELGQTHLFHELKQCEKSHRIPLAEQIVGINTKLLGTALRVLESPTQTTGRVLPNRNDFKRYVKGSSGHGEYAERGRELMVAGKVAFVVVLEEDGFDVDRFVKDWEVKSAPLIFVCDEETLPESTVGFEENGFEKVSFMKEETMPVVRSGEKREIVTTSSFQVKEHPIGSFGVVTSLTQRVMEEIVGADVEYIVVLGWRVGCGSVARGIVGLVDMSEADIGIVWSSEMECAVLSVGGVKALGDDVETAPLEAVEVSPGEFGFRCGIVSAILKCYPLRDLCVLDITK